MSLVNITYGSTASSATMNNNFSYLDNKIDTTAETIATSISSILSNIATINTRITDLSDSLSEAMDSLGSTIESYKTKTKLLVKQSTSVPNWAALTSIDISETDYTLASNGYILIASTAEAITLTINNIDIAVKNDSEKLPLICFPVKAGDVLSANENVSNAYFLPAAVISVSGF